MEQLLAGGLRRLQCVVGLFQEYVEQLLVDLTFGGAQPVAVEGLGPVGQPDDRGVDQRVARTGVERARLVAGAYDRQVGDPADVQRGGRATAVREQQHVQRARQRRPLTAGRDVAGAKVGDDGEPGRLRDPGRLPELQRPADSGVLDPVEQRLSVGDHQVGVAVAQLGDPAAGRGGELLTDPGVDAADGLHRRLRRRQRGQDVGAQRRAVRHLEVAERREHDRVGVEGQVGSGDVDAVDRRTRDETQDDHGAPSSPTASRTLPPARARRSRASSAPTPDSSATIAVFTWPSASPSALSASAAPAPVTSATMR